MLMMMGYFRGPRLSGRKAEREVRGESLRTALLVDEEAAADTVPKGYFAVYVGAEARRFVVPTSYLCQPAFRELMERAAEEFGFGQAGGLRIPCREEDFQATVTALEDADAARQRRRPSRRSGGKINTMVKARSLFLPSHACRSCTHRR